MTEEYMERTIGVPQAEVDTAAKKARQAALNLAYRTATNTVRANHQDEFNTEYEKEAASLGHEWHPRLTAEQKAEKEFEALLEAHPHLADKIKA